MDANASQYQPDRIASDDRGVAIIVDRTYNRKWVVYNADQDRPSKL